TMQIIRGSAANPSLTRTGTTMGTAAYMSPEQIRGETLDRRTDLFFFGLVLYEMATGKQAFAGDTRASVHEAILERTTAPARELNPVLPAKLGQVISKALEKDREARYQYASEIQAELKAFQLEINAIPAAPLVHRRLRWPLATAALATALLALG